MSSGPVLEATGLTKHFPVLRWRGLRPERRVVRALEDVDLVLHPGECLGLVGESGSGKTTLARCLALHEAPDAGRILLEGVDLATMSGSEQRRRRRRLQLVFQDSAAALDPRQRVGESVAEGLDRETTTTERTERVAELFDAVGLAPGLAGRWPHQLSGGQRQRVAIARALAAEPAVVLLDEPVSALDATVRRKILRRLDDLRFRFGVGMVFVGHDLGVVASVADRIAVLYLGRVVETGPTAQVLESPRHPYTAALLAAVPEPVPGRRPTPPLSDEVPSPETPPSGCAFHPRCPRADARCREERPRLEIAAERDESTRDEAGSERFVACHWPLP